MPVRIPISGLRSLGINRNHSLWMIISGRTRRIESLLAVLARRPSTETAAVVRECQRLRSILDPWDRCRICRIWHLQAIRTHHLMDCQVRCQVCLQEVHQRSHHLTEFQEWCQVCPMECLLQGVRRVQVWWVAQLILLLMECRQVCLSECLQEVLQVWVEQLTHSIWWRTLTCHLRTVRYRLVSLTACLQELFLRTWAQLVVHQLYRQLWICPLLKWSWDKCSTWTQLKHNNISRHISISIKTCKNSLSNIKIL